MILFDKCYMKSFENINILIENLFFLKNFFREKSFYLKKTHFWKKYFYLKKNFLKVLLKKIFGKNVFTSGT